MLLPTRAICITIDRSRADRYVRTIRELHRLGYVDAAITTVDGVRGTDLSDCTLKDVTTASTYFHIRQGRRTDHTQIDSVGAVGCALSHALAWRACATYGEPVLVVEDDVTTPHTRDSLQALVESAPESFDILRLSRIMPWFHPATERTDDETWEAGGVTVSTAMYIVTPRAARVLMKYVQPIDTHVDMYMSMVAKKYGLTEYTVRKSVVEECDAQSTIQHTEPQPMATAAQRAQQGTSLFFVLVITLSVLAVAVILTY